MSARLETAAEVLKLARLLGVPPEELDYLEAVPASELRVLREGVIDRMFSAGARSLQRIGAAARLLPSPLVASIAQRAFGPLLCARAAGAVDPGKAVDVATRLPADFLADVTVELDPRRVADIIANVPEELVVPVAAELGRRDEAVTMGRFLAFVPDHAIAAAMAALSDEVMLRTAFVLEHKDRLDHAVGLLPPDRLPGILRCASELDLWPEALDLLDHLSDERRGPIADTVAELEAPVLERLVRAVSEGGLWENLLPVVGTMSPEHRLTLAAQPAFHEPGILREIVHAAGASALWGDVLPLLQALPDDVRRAAVTALGPAEMAGLLDDALGRPELLASLAEVVAGLDAGARTAVVDVIEAVGPSLGERVGEALEDPSLVALLDGLPDDVRTAIQGLVVR